MHGERTERPARRESRGRPGLAEAEVDLLRHVVASRWLSQMEVAAELGMDGKSLVQLLKCRLVRNFLRTLDEYELRMEFTLRLQSDRDAERVRRFGEKDWERMLRRGW